MLGQLFVYPLFIAACFAGVFRPYWGLVGFYVFVFLDPEWNWRWSIPQGSGFQKYLAASVLVGFLFHGFRGNRWSGWMQATAFCLLGFLTLAYASSLQTLSPRLTEFYLGVIAKVIVIALVGLKLIDSPRKAWVMLWVIVIAQGYNAFRINEQYFTDGYSLYAMRPWGTKGDNNLYSIFTVPAMAASLALAIYSEKKWQVALAGGILIMQIHQLMLMESRGTMVGAIFLFAAGVFFMPKNRFTIGSTVVAAVIVAILACPPVVEEFMSAFKPQEELDSSASSRMKLWKGGLAITKDYPLLGVGPYAGQVLVPQYVPEFSDKSIKGLHNLLFEISTGCGVPATILYFGFFLIPWYYITKLYWRARDTLPLEIGALGLTIACGVPGYFVASMFSSGALLESSYCMIVTCAGGVWAWQRMPAEEEVLLGEAESQELPLAERPGGPGGNGPFRQPSTGPVR